MLGERHARTRKEPTPIFYSNSVSRIEEHKNTIKNELMKQISNTDHKTK